MKKEKIIQNVVYLAGLFAFLMSIRYIWLTIQKEIEPVFTTWLLFCVGASLSYWTYWSSKKHSIAGNLGNAVDLIMTWMILIGITFWGTKNFDFNNLEIYCLISCLIIFVFWKLSKKHFVSNISIQVIMTIAYLPTIQKLWEATHSTESLPYWGINLFGSLTFLTMGIIKKDLIGIIYSSRAFILVLLVIIFILMI